MGHCCPHLSLIIYLSCLATHIRVPSLLQSIWLKNFPGISFPSWTSTISVPLQQNILSEPGEITRWMLHRGGVSEYVYWHNFIIIFRFMFRSTSSCKNSRSSQTLLLQARLPTLPEGPESSHFRDPRFTEMLWHFSRGWKKGMRKLWPSGESAMMPVWYNTRACTRYHL